MEQIDDILNKANECLNCKKAQCKEGCPVSTNIPEFINEIKHNNLKNAYYILQENNLLSEICSAICPVEKQCMKHCVKTLKSNPTQINSLEKFVNEWASANNIEYNTKISNISNKKVAVIGSGPSSLSCAIELRKAGCEVSIFEKESKCGGILQYGIPEFRLSKKVVDTVIERIKKLGVKIYNNKEFGKDITIEGLKKQGFEIIFLGIGAQEATIYTTSNEQTEDIYIANDFLKKFNTCDKISNLGKTIVIGGGNVAFDSARAAIKMGATEVCILYRRTKDLMPAREIELEDAINDGVKIEYQTKVLSSNIKNGKLKEIECIKTKIEDNRAVEIEGSNFYIDANTLIFAIGSKVKTELFNKLGIETENGLIKIDENYKTNIEGVYAGGDLVEARSTVAKAIATGKKAAQAILKL